MLSGETKEEFFDEVNSHFPSVYYIKKDEAKRLNLYGFPSWYFINGERVIAQYEIGISFEVNHKIDQLLEFFQ